jgi:hypothetical protein
MNWDRIAGQWKQFKGKAKEKWGQLTDDEIDMIDRPISAIRLEGLETVDRQLVLNNVRAAIGDPYAPEIVRGDVRPVHAQLVEAAAGKNVWIVGGGELAGEFHDHGLLDELIVQVTPVTLGGGAPLLPRAITSPPLQLLSVETFGDAFVEIRYAVPRG